MARPFCFPAKFFRFGIDIYSICVGPGIAGDTKAKDNAMEFEDRTMIERAVEPPEVAVSDTELVLLDVAGGHYQTLQGSTAVRIWQLLARPRSLAMLLKELDTEFDAEPGRCREETISFLNALAAKGLIRASPSELDTGGP